MIILNSKEKHIKNNRQHSERYIVERGDPDAPWLVEKIMVRCVGRALRVREINANEMFLHGRTEFAPTQIK